MALAMNKVVALFIAAVLISGIVTRGVIVDGKRTHKVHGKDIIVDAETLHTIRTVTEGAGDEERKNCLTTAPEEFKELDEACKNTDSGRAIEAAARIFSTQEKPVLLAMFGGIANGKSSAKDTVVARLRADDQDSSPTRFDFLDAGKSELIMNIPEYVKFVQEKGRTLDCQVAAYFACRKTINQEDALELAAKKRLSFKVEWTAPPNLNTFANKTSKWSKDLDSHAIVFVLVTVADFNSVKEVEAKRALETGLAIPSGIVESFNKGMNYHYLRAVQTLIKNGVGESRRFLVQRRCEATDDQVELVDITDDARINFSITEDNADALMDEIVPLDCDGNAARALAKGLK